MNHQLLCLLANSLPLFIIIGDTTPPSMRGVCPGDIIAFADKFQVNTKVTWRENKAFDETDGYVE